MALSNMIISHSSSSSSNYKTTTLPLHQQNERLSTRTLFSSHSKNDDSKSMTFRTTPAKSLRKPSLSSSLISLKSAPTISLRKSSSHKDVGLPILRQNATFGTATSSPTKSATATRTIRRSVLSPQSRKDLDLTLPTTRQCRLQGTRGASNSTFSFLSTSSTSSSSLSKSLSTAAIASLLRPTKLTTSPSTNSSTKKSKTTPRSVGPSGTDLGFIRRPITSSRSFNSRLQNIATVQKSKSPLRSSRKSLLQSASSHKTPPSTASHLALPSGSDHLNSTASVYNRDRDYYYSYQQQQEQQRRRQQRTSLSPRRPSRSASSTFNTSNYARINNNREINPLSRSLSPKRTPTNRTTKTAAAGAGAMTRPKTNTTGTTSTSINVPHRRSNTSISSSKIQRSKPIKTKRLFSSSQTTDEKYQKRSKQQQQRYSRMAIACFLLYFIAMVVFGYTWGRDYKSQILHLGTVKSRAHLATNPPQPQPQPRHEPDEMEQQQKQQQLLQPDKILHIEADNKDNNILRKQDTSGGIFEQIIEFINKRLRGSSDTTSKQQQQEQPSSAFDTLKKKNMKQSLISSPSDSTWGQFFRGNRKANNDEPSQQLQQLDTAIRTNQHSGIAWMNPNLLQSLETNAIPNPLLEKPINRPKSKYSSHGPFFRVARLKDQPMTWEITYNDNLAENTNYGIAVPKIDYTKYNYQYPAFLPEPPAELGTYPQLRSFVDIYQVWPQDDIDTPPDTIIETLQHFDFTNRTELQAAQKFRDAKLPFKLTNVPELLAANSKWTDEYVASHFDYGIPNDNIPKASGTCQESKTNFFAFFQPNAWNVETMGLPPTRNNDWTFAKWAQHAKYADSIGLDSDQPHFYYQAGVPSEERELPQETSWTFISRDLPSFSATTPNFITFNPAEQKGIQCRFGERGVTAATHYDAGQNMVGMITGAKRYVLSPPRECSNLGIVPNRGNAMFRHSLLNFGHLNHLSNDDDNNNSNNRGMSSIEHDWLERASTAQVVETVLKAGEVLFIPSHWFHYITSLQKSAQCNVRSGVDIDGDTYFGGQTDVVDHCHVI